MALLLKSFAGVGVAYRHREEAQTEGQHDDVQHEMLLAALVFGRNFCAFPGRWIAMDQSADRIATLAYPYQWAWSAIRRIGFRDRRGTNVIGKS